MRRADKALSGLIGELGRPTNHAEGILLFDALTIRNDRLKQENDLLRDAWQENGTELKALKAKHAAIVEECGKTKALLERAYSALSSEQTLCQIAKRDREHMRGLLAEVTEREANARQDQRERTQRQEGIISRLRADLDAAQAELAHLRQQQPAKQQSAVLRERGRWIEMGETE